MMSQGVGECRETGTQQAGKREVRRVRPSEPEVVLTNQGMTCNSHAPGNARGLSSAWLDDCMPLWHSPRLGAPWLLRRRRLCYRAGLQQHRALHKAIWRRGQCCWRLAWGLGQRLGLGMLLEDSLHG